MRIVRPGKPKRDWPVGARLTCPSCGCEFELDANDLIVNWRVVDDQRDGLSVRGTCPQPGCNKYVVAHPDDAIREVA